MASAGEEQNAGNSNIRDVPVGGRTLTSLPASTENVISDVMRQNENFSQINGPIVDEEQAEENVRLTTADQTLELEMQPIVQASMSEAVKGTPERVHANESINRPMTGSREQIAVQDMPEAVTSDLKTTSLYGSTPGSSPGNNNRHTSPDSVTSDDRNTSWKDFATQTVIGPGFSPESTRPTSVPNFQSKSISRRREGPDYPTYPDQSFKALQSQQYPPPYHPGSPHPLRTRSSHPSQNIPFSSDNPNDISDTPQPSSGAKTVGNTPAQSPGLFSPMFPVRKPWAGESDSGRANTPMLHPSHHKEPKE